MIAFYINLLTDLMIEVPSKSSRTLLDHFEQFGETPEGNQFSLP